MHRSGPPYVTKWSCSELALYTPCIESTKPLQARGIHLLSTFGPNQGVLRNGIPPVRSMGRAPAGGLGAKPQKVIFNVNFLRKV